jgi:flagellar hook protein FlgE
MLRSLFSAISGLRANQTMLDVTGNNIANANTAGFKSSTVVFQDTLSQMLTGGSAAVPGDPAAGTPGAGGTNPMQIGLGVQVGGTTTNFTQGGTQSTGSATNLMISGDGFFVINRDGNDLYTRAGAFNFDSEGQLVSPDGDIVQGMTFDANGAVVVDANGDPVLNDIRIPGLVDQDTDTNNDGTAGPVLRSYSIGSNGVISGVYADGTQKDLFQVALANFANPNGLEKVGDTAYREGTNSGDPVLGGPGEGRNGTIMGSSLEMSNVDLAAEFTNLIIAQRGFQATARVITTSDQVLEELVNIKR